jgi:predicted DNA-binding helix-hairpin-helix protein
LKKERVPVNIEVGTNKQRKELSMTDKAVQIRITIRVAESERKIEEKILPEEIEESIERIAKTAGQESL